jgi:predicted DNA repair protein MutK
MAAASLLALLDDIAVLLDDVSIMTKVAAKKTAGVLGDDLAVNAERVTGVAAHRELPVVFAVFRGSLLNKAILVPAALLIAALAPWLITPLLMAGGLFLCFEGAEKVWHALAHPRSERDSRAEELRAAVEAPDFDPLSFERRKIRGAIRTDFILSAEIIVITLGIVGEASLGVRAAVLSGIAVVMTVGVYGLVAAIVKIDDAGLYLVQQQGGVRRAVGRALLALAPRLMKLLTVLGTLAMFLVGGGILTHAVHGLHAMSEWLLGQVRGLPLGGLLEVISPVVFNGVLGLAAGLAVLAVVALISRLRGAPGAAETH